MALKDIGVRLVVENIGGFVRDMDRYNDRIARAETATNRFAERAGKAGRALAALGAPLAAIGLLSVRAATDFETAFIGVARTIEATDAELAILERGFRDLALEIPFTAIQLANIGAIAGRLGVQAGDVLEFTQVVADLGVATNLTEEAAAEFLARMQAITQLPTADLTAFSSTIVDLGNNLATSEQDIAAFALRIAAAGSIAGLTQAEILAISGSFAELGIQAQRGGTAVQKVLFQMNEAVAAGNEQLTGFAAAAGVTTSEFARLFEDDAAEAFTLFVEGLGRDGDKAFQILRDLGLADQRLAQAFITVATAGDSMRQNIELATNAFEMNTALAEEANRQYASTAAQFTVFKNELLEVALVIGGTLIPPLLTLIKTARPLIGFVAEFAENNKTLTLILVGLSVLLIGVGGALLAISFIAPGVVAGVGLIITAVGFLTGAFAGLSIAMGPITLIVLGIAAAIAVGILIWKNWGTIVDFVKDSVNSFIEIINTLIRVMLRLNPLFAPLTAGMSLLGIDVPQIPTFRHGGTQQQMGRALVGEAGPEIVTLPPGAGVTPISQINEINVQATYTNPQEPNSIRMDMEFILMAVQA